MDTSNGPFIGSEALASGYLTRYELRRHHRAIMPNVYLDKRLRPSLRHRTHAAWLWSGRAAVVAGLAAAALHGTKWVDDGEPIELIWRNARSPHRVITRADLLLESEVQLLDGLTATTPQRTAFDIGRRGRLGAAVARLDALGNITRFNADDVLTLAARHSRGRGLRQLETALDLYDPGAQSPKETWLRTMLMEEGFPRPQTQIPVPGPDGHPLYYLDMGWEDMTLAVEYDGVQHADQLGYDIVRNEYIARVGWTTVRVAAGHRRPEIVARVRRAWDSLTSPLVLR
jgi:very-short-patch-repair endonuclease